MKIDYKSMYLGRIDQINVDIKAAIYKKDWKLKAKLGVERKIIEERIEKLV